MNYLEIIKLTLILFCFSANTLAGCPAMGIENGEASVIQCNFKITPSGALFQLNLNYKDNFRMPEPSAQNLKASAFMATEDKNVCDQFKSNEKYCVNLSLWCPMSGNAPHSAKFIMSTIKKGPCLKEAKPKL